jgi:hypothetical protein
MPAAPARASLGTTGQGEAATPALPADAATPCRSSAELRGVVPAGRPAPRPSGSAQEEIDRRDHPHLLLRRVAAGAFLHFIAVARGDREIALGAERMPPTAVSESRANCSAARRASCVAMAIISGFTSFNLVKL